MPETPVFRKVYTLTVTFEPPRSGVDWQLRRLRVLCRDRSFTKTFDTLEAAKAAMDDAQKSPTPPQCRLKCRIHEQFAFQDPLQMNDWHLLSTQSVKIL